MQRPDATSEDASANHRASYALDFRADSVALMRREVGVATMSSGGRFALKERPGGAWSEIALSAWLPQDDGAAPELADPDTLRAALTDQPAKVDIWLPEALLLSRTVDDDSAPDDDTPAERIAARAIAGLTVLRPDSLKLAAARVSGGIAVRAVERAVLDEVCAHALRWKFQIGTVRSHPGDAAFPDGAAFATAPPKSPRKPRKDKAGGKHRISSLTLMAIGGGAALLGLAIFLATAPLEPDSLPDPVVFDAAPDVAPGPDVPAPVADASPGTPSSPEHAKAEPAPIFERLESEVAFSAPAEQFAPAAEAPEIPRGPALEASTPLPDAPDSILAPADQTAETLGVEPSDAPADTPTEAPEPPAETALLASPPLVEPPTSPQSEEAADLAALAPLENVSVDDDAGKPSEGMHAPEDAPAIEGNPTQPEVREPAAEAPSDPPGGLSGLTELGDADLAALTLEDAPSPLAPSAELRDELDPAPVPLPAFRPTQDPDAPLEPAGENDVPPITELAPEKARPPKPRPKAIAERVEATFVSAAAPEEVAPPRPRPAAVSEMPAKLKAAAERARAERAARAAERRKAPSAAEIAAVATEQMEWDTLDGFMLIGVFERVGGRSALMRLPNGDVRRVQAGDRIGRWTVATIERASISLDFEGASQTLRMPSVN